MSLRPEVDSATRTNIHRSTNLTRLQQILETSGKLDANGPKMSKDDQGVHTFMGKHLTTTGPPLSRHLFLTKLLHQFQNVLKNFLQTLVFKHQHFFSPCLQQVGKCDNVVAFYDYPEALFATQLLMVISGSSTMSALRAANPACSAMNPEWRPILIP